MTSEILEKQCKWMNEAKGDLHKHDEYFCSVCQNKGQVFFIRREEIVARRCDCLAVRRSMRLLAKSGLDGAVQEKTFDSFRVSLTEIEPNWFETANSLMCCVQKA